MGRSQQVPRAGPAPGPPGDDTGCPILHVDMDAFYASVEVRRRPELAGRPVIVGGVGPRGVVSSASYAARRFGVHSAMPMSRARRLCPHAVVVPPDIAGYAEVSRAVMGIFREVTPLVEPLSLDEAFLDVAGARRRLGPPAAIGGMIRDRIVREQGLTASVGVAATKFVAKVASARCKPDGLLVVPAAAVADFLHPLPVAALWGVGERTEEQLRRIGIRLIGDVAAVPTARLRGVLGVAGAAQLSALARGHDPRPVVPHEPERSIGAEQTFDVDVADPATVHRELLRLAARSAARLRAAGQRGRTVSIKVRLADFTTLTRSRTLDRPTDVGQEVYAVARALFDALDRAGASVRLIGVRLEGLTGEGADVEQLTLGARRHGWRDADRAVDAAARRFGADAVRPATLVPGSPPADPGP